MIKSNTKRRIKRLKEGTAWYKDGQLTDAGNAAASTIGGISSIAGTAGTMIDSLAGDNESSGANYAASALSSAGSLASAGAAFGPYGAIAGGVLGGVLGLVQQGEKAKQQKREDNYRLIGQNMKSIDNLNSSIRTQSAVRNSKNYAVPGFKNGTASSFSPNAMIANEEGIKDPDTGRIDVVPGEYDYSNPDKVMANLKDGTSVYSNAYKLPGGNSTPAKIISRMKKVQDKSDKIMSGGKPASSIDLKTAELNRKNIDIQTELLNMNTILENSDEKHVDSKLKRYKLGGTITNSDKGYFSDIIDTYNSREFNRISADELAKKGLFYDPGNNGSRSGWRLRITNPNFYNKSKLSAAIAPDENGLSRISYGPQQPQQQEQAQSTSDWTVAGQKIAPSQDWTSGYGKGFVYPSKNIGGNISNDLKNAYDDYVRNGGTDNFDYFKTKISETSAGLNYNGQDIQNKPVLSQSKASLPINNTNVPTETKVPEIALKQPNTQSVVHPSIPSIDNISLPSGTSSYTVSNPTINEYGVTEDMPNVETTSPVTKEKPGLNRNVFKNSLGDKLSSLATDVASLIPVASNLFNAKAETERPIYNNISNPVLRANISKQIEDSRRQRQIARYNQSVMGAGSGIGNAYGRSIYSGGVEQMNSIFANADNMNNQYRAQYAQLENQNQAANRAEDRRVSDLNARNRAAARNMKSAAYSQLSQYAQNKQLMKNQKERDVLQSNIWSMYASNSISPDKLKEINKILGIK